MSTNLYPNTFNHAEQRFYAWYRRRFHGSHWIDILRSCTALGVPEPAHPTTIEAWRAVARVLAAAVRAREAWEAREWTDEEIASLNLPKWGSPFATYEGLRFVRQEDGW